MVGLMRFNKSTNKSTNESTNEVQAKDRSLHSGAEASGLAEARARSGILRGIKNEDVVISVFYFALFWVLTTANLAQTAMWKLPWFEQMSFIFAVVACFGVLVRRSAPGLMAVIVVPMTACLLLASNYFWIVAIFEVFFSLVLFGGPRTSKFTARFAFIVTIAGVVIFYIVTLALNFSILFGLLLALTILMPVEWASNLRKAQQLTAVESARAEAVKEASEQRLLAEQSANELMLEQQRQHLARELHDVVSARLSAIALQSGATLHASREAEGQDRHAKVLHNIRHESIAGLAELNRMIRLLHTGVLAETPGRLSQLKSLVERHRSSGAEVALYNELPHAGSWLSPDQQTALFRIISEALSNAGKHAPSQPVTINLSLSLGSANELELQITNPLGTGQESHSTLGELNGLLETDGLAENHGLAETGGRAGTGTGIPAMAFRASYLGGTLQAGPDQGQWNVSCRLPVPSDDQQSKFKNSESTAMEFIAPLGQL